MNTKTIFFSLFVAVISIKSVVDALPDGSPVCSVGGAAPRSLHLSRATIVTGNLTFGTYQVKIGNLTLGDTIVNTIPSNTNLPVVLSSTNGTQFKGVLIVLNQPNTILTSNLMIDPNSTDLKPQAACVPANNSGFTHINNTLKSTASLTISLPSSQAAFLDVNVVVTNDGATNTSIYYYTRYQLIGAAAVAPVPVPVAPVAPVPVAPVAPVPVAPVPVPLKAPVPAPVPVPLPPPVPANKPTNAPFRMNTVAPVSKAPSPPTKSPTKSPTKAPVRDDCGLFGLNIFCPFTFCGIFGRLLGLC